MIATNKIMKDMQLQIRKLGEICELQKIKNDKKLLPYIGMEDIESNTGKFIGSLIPKKVKSLTFYFNSNHILYGRLRPYLNKVLMPNFEGHCSTEIFPIKANDTLAKKYLFYWLTCDEIVKKINATCTGARMPRANMKDVLDFGIPLPHLPEQHRIVKILDEVFEKTTKAEENAEKNLQNSKELFESYLQSIFAKRGVDWEEKRLGEVCDLKSGVTIPKKLEKTAGAVLYVKVGDMNLAGNELCINSSSRFVDLKDLKQNQIIPEGSVIFPKRGGAIFTNKRRKIIKPTIVDLNTMALVPSKIINPDFLYYWFLRIDLTDLNNGSSIPQINNYSFDNTFISYPKSLSEQKSIVVKLDALSSETKKLEAIYKQKLDNLEELKKSVLKKAFSGEL